MNVFLPYPDYFESIKVLDKKRCWKQVVEAKQLIDAILGKGSISWRKHPACKMFMKNVNSLIKYHNICLDYCIKKHNIKVVKSKFIPYVVGTLKNPNWLGDEEFHKVMRQNLTRKNPNHYSQFWTEEPREGYIWKT